MPKRHNHGEIGFAGNLKTTNQGERWFSIDPKANVFPDNSPYVFSLNNPIVLNDPNGDCPPGVNCGDVVDNAAISNGNTGINYNRFGRVERTRKDGTKYYHTGIDILAKKGTQLKAVMAGEVVSIFNSSSLGNTVVIKTKLPNGNYVWIQYSHLDEVKVAEKQQVKVGEVFGIAGNTGNAKNIPVKDHHVHIEASTDGIFYGGKNRIDPEQFFKTKYDGNGQPIIPKIPIIQEAERDYKLEHLQHELANARITLEIMKINAKIQAEKDSLKVPSEQPENSTIPSPSE